ncbi:MAG: Gfo/Idh/MocA family oxidoreductase [Acidobacteria bacterium]|nr:Gfo/Idh/MocA family oxidoreductase [Acidobacteriota bacterium]
MAKQVKVGIIGAGWWAVENHIPVLKAIDGVEVAGLCRLGKEELQRICGRFDIGFGTEDYRELLELDGLDGVVVSSPHHLHFEHTRAALEKGISALCEKPMTLTAPDARELDRIARLKGKHVVVPFGWNYTDFAHEARGRLQNGAVGEVLHVHCHMASALLDLLSGEGAWFAEQAAVKPEMATWSDPATGGGFGYGQLCHALGLLFYITDLEPAEVFAMMRFSKTGADLSNAICCRFRNGVTGMIGGAATMPPYSTYQVDIRVFGREGMLLLDVERPRLEVRRCDGAHFSMEMTAKPGEYACVEPLRAFVSLLRGEQVENRSPASLGVRTIEVLDAAFRSVRSGQAEKV